MRKSDEALAKPNPMKSTSKPPIYATKRIPEAFTHTRGRFRRFLHVHRRPRETERQISEHSQIRECKAFTNQTNTKNEIMGRRRLGNGEKRREKGRRNDVTEERERSPTNFV